MDKKSYALGIAIGQKVAYDMSTSGIELSDVNLNDVFDGIIDTVNNNKTKVNLKEASDELDAFIRESVKKLAKKNQEGGARFLESFMTNKGAVKTDSGLCYIDLTRDKHEDTIGEEDTVLCHIVGSFTDGTVFINTRNVHHNNPKWLNVASMIPGLTEGLQLMYNGARFEFTVPYQLAYGPEGNDRFPGYATLHFDIEVLDHKTEK